MKKWYEIHCHNGQQLFRDTVAMERLLDILDLMTDKTGAFPALRWLFEKVKRQKEERETVNLTVREACQLQTIFEKYKEECVGKGMGSKDEEILNGFEELAYGNSSESEPKSKIRIKKQNGDDLTFSIPVSLLEAVSMRSLLTDLQKENEEASEKYEPAKKVFANVIETLKEDSILDGVETIGTFSEKDLILMNHIILQTLFLYEEKKDPDYWAHCLPALIACDQFRRKAAKVRKDQTAPVTWKLAEGEPFTLTLPQMEEVFSILYLVKDEEETGELSALRKELSEKMNEARDGKDAVCMVSEGEENLIKRQKKRYQDVMGKLQERGLPKHPEDVWICCL